MDSRPMKNLCLWAGDEWSIPAGAKVMMPNDVADARKAAGLAAEWVDEEKKEHSIAVAEKAIAVEAEVSRITHPLLNSQPADKPPVSNMPLPDSADVNVSAVLTGLQLPDGTTKFDPAPAPTPLPEPDGAPTGLLIHGQPAKDPADHQDAATDVMEKARQAEAETIARALSGPTLNGQPADVPPMVETGQATEGGVVLEPGAIDLPDEPDTSGVPAPKRRAKRASVLD